MSKMISSTRPFCLCIPWFDSKHASYKYNGYSNLFGNKMGPKLNKMLYYCFHTSPMPCYLIAMQIVHHSSWHGCLLDAFIHMLAHFIYVGPCLFGSSSNRRWAGDISREPGALPRSVSRFNWVARQALPHACIHTVPIASNLLLHHWVAIALNWILSIA